VLVASAHLPSRSGAGRKSDRVAFCRGRSTLSRIFYDIGPLSAWSEHLPTMHWKSALMVIEHLLLHMASAGRGQGNGSTKT